MRRQEGHLFSCEEVSPQLCDTALEEGVEIPELMEDKRLFGVNWQQSLSYALDLNNQFQINVPLVVQAKDYTFTRVDNGQVYTAPDGYTELFHPDQTTVGFGDVQFAGQHYWFLPTLVLGAEVGVNLPTASTKFNEYSLLEFHQPLGTGTVVPTGRFILFSRGETQGVLSSTALQLPLYENSEAYRTGSSASFDIGYWRRFSEQDVVLLSQLSVQHENRDRWHDQLIPYSHRSFVRGALMGTYAFSDSLEGMMRMEIQLHRQVWEDDTTGLESLSTPVFNVGLTWL